LKEEKASILVLNTMQGDSKFTGKCLKCGKAGQYVRNCFTLKGPEEVKSLLEKHREESRKSDSPRLPSIGSSERISVVLDGKIEAEAVLDSAASYTFVSQELVERLGIEVVDQGEIKKVAWVTRGVSPIVVRVSRFVIVYGAGHWRCTS
jgi:hypothetical protein